MNIEYEGCKNHQKIPTGTTALLLQNLGTKKITHISLKLRKKSIPEFGWKENNFKLFGHHWQHIRCQRHAEHSDATKRI